LLRRATNARRRSIRKYPVNSDERTSDPTYAVRPSLILGSIVVASRGSDLYNVHILARPHKDTYHHGDLREALLKAAEKIIRQEGLHALTLRAAARAAGVSHAAPAHHFKDLAGLFTELAIVGFRRMRDYMERAAREPSYMPWFLARAYVLFAIENPELFLLMFRSQILDPKNPTLQHERAETFARLAQTSDVAVENLTLAQLGALTAGWSIAHGFAMLYIDGPIKRLLKHAPPDTEMFDLLQAAYATLTHSKQKSSDPS
jgi:AcrR family transcriptional regulator